MKDAPSAASTLIVAGPGASLDRFAVAARDLTAGTALNMVNLLPERERTMSVYIEGTLHLARVPDPQDCSVGDIPALRYQLDAAVTTADLEMLVPVSATFPDLTFWWVLGLGDAGCRVLEVRAGTTQADVATEITRIMVAKTLPDGRVVVIPTRAPVDVRDRPRWHAATYRQNRPLPPPDHAGEAGMGTGIGIGSACVTAPDDQVAGGSQQSHESGRAERQDVAWLVPLMVKLWVAVQDRWMYDFPGCVVLTSGSPLTDHAADGSPTAASAPPVGMGEDQVRVLKEQFARAGLWADMMCRAGDGAVDEPVVAVEFSLDGPTSVEQIVRHGLAMAWFARTPLVEQMWAHRTEYLLPFLAEALPRLEGAELRVRALELALAASADIHPVLARRAVAAWRSQHAEQSPALPADSSGAGREPASWPAGPVDVSALAVLLAQLEAGQPGWMGMCGQDDPKAVVDWAVERLRVAQAASTATNPA